MAKFCSSPWDSVGVYANGEISSCLCAGWHTWGGGMGSILDNKFVDVFRNQNFNTFRESIEDQSFKYCLEDQCAKLWDLDEVDDVKAIVKPTLPTWLNVQIDMNCNLKCGSCRDDIMWEKPANPTAEKILDRLVEAYQDYDTPVIVQGDGSGDIFASTAWLNFFKRDDLPKCFQFNLTTNGNLITKNLDVLEKIKDQIFSVCISFDSATPETYKIVRGGKFQKLVDAVKAMQDMNIYRVNTSFVTQLRNYREVLDHYYMCKELNINYSGLSRIDRWDHMTDMWYDENKLDNNPRIDYEFLIPALKFIQQDPKFGLCGGLLELINRYDSGMAMVKETNNYPTFDIKPS